MSRYCCCGGGPVGWINRGATLAGWQVVWVGAGRARGGNGDTEPWHPLLLGYEHTEEGGDGKYSGTCGKSASDAAEHGEGFVAGWGVQQAEAERAGLRCWTDVNPFEKVRVDSVFPTYTYRWRLPFGACFAACRATARYFPQPLNHRLHGTATFLLALGVDEGINLGFAHSFSPQ